MGREDLNPEPEPYSNLCVCHPEFLIKDGEKTTLHEPPKNEKTK